MGFCQIFILWDIVKFSFCGILSNFHFVGFCQIFICEILSNFHFVGFCQIFICEILSNFHFVGFCQIFILCDFVKFSFSVPLCVRFNRV